MAPDRLVPSLIGAVLCAATVALLPSHGATSGWSVPFSPTLAAPTGEHPVGVRHHVVTTASEDPWDTSERRSVMVDLHYPAEAGPYPLTDYSKANYMSELAMLRWQPSAEARMNLTQGDVNWAFRVHAHEWAPPASEPMPVVVFSAPPGAMRTQYTLLAEDLASHGFLVVTIDHPHDAPVVELFPTRQVITDEDRSDVSSSVIARLRIEDIEHVVRNLGGIDPEITPHVDGTRVGLIGWLGESTEQVRRLAALPGVRAVVALGSFASPARGARDSQVLALRSTPLVTLSDDATLLHQIAQQVDEFALPEGVSDPDRLAPTLDRVRAFLQEELAG